MMIRDMLEVELVQVKIMLPKREMSIEGNNLARDCRVSRW